MWKLLVAFAAFAGLAIFILTKSGADVDMGGEKHSVDAPAATATGASGAASSGH